MEAIALIFRWVGISSFERVSLEQSRPASPGDEVEGAIPRSSNCNHVLLESSVFGSCHTFVGSQSAQIPHVSMKALRRAAVPAFGEVQLVLAL